MYMYSYYTAICTLCLKIGFALFNKEKKKNTDLN